MSEKLTTITTRVELLNPVINGKTLHMENDNETRCETTYQKKSRKQQSKATTCTTIAVQQVDHAKDEDTKRWKRTTTTVGLPSTSFLQSELTIRRVTQQFVM
eukprot:3790403-Amphidinium_carterae.1